MKKIITILALNFLLISGLIFVQQEVFGKSSQIKSKQSSAMTKKKSLRRKSKGKMPKRKIYPQKPPEQTQQITQPKITSSKCANDIGNGAEIIDGPSGPEGDDRDNPFRSLTVHPTDPNIILIGTERNGFLKSIDGGVTWSRLRYGLRHEGPGYAEMYDVGISETDPNIIYAATTDSPGPLTGQEHNFSGIYKSEDSGKTWLRKNCGVESNGGRTTTMWADPLDSNHAIAGISADFVSYYTATVKAGQYIPGGLYETFDGGENWKKISAAPHDADNGYNYIRSAKSKPSLVFTFGFAGDPVYNVGFLKSEDSGRTWQAFAPELRDIHISHFDVSGDGKEIAAISDTPGQVSELLVSTDSGNTWNHFPLRTSGYTVTISPNDSQRILFGLIFGLQLSTDGGRTQQQVITLDDARISDVVFAKSDPNTVYAITTGYHLYKSTNGGETFQLLRNLRMNILNNVK